MITNRNRYEHVKGIDSIRIAGEIMTRRADKKVLAGEDLAFIAESSLTKQNIAFGSNQEFLFENRASLGQLNDILTLANGCLRKPILWKDNLANYDFVARQRTGDISPIEFPEWNKHFAGVDPESLSDFVSLQTDQILRYEPVLEALNTLPHTRRIVVGPIRRWALGGTLKTSTFDDYSGNPGISALSSLERVVYSRGPDLDVPGRSHDLTNSVSYNRRIVTPVYEGGTISGEFYYNYVKGEWIWFDDIPEGRKWEKGMSGKWADFREWSDTSVSRTITCDVSNIRMYRLESVQPIITYQLVSRCSGNMFSGLNTDPWASVPTGISTKEQVHYITEVHPPIRASAGNYFDIPVGLPHNMSTPTTYTPPASPVYGRSFADMTGGFSYENWVDVVGVDFIVKLNDEVTAV